MKRPAKNIKFELVKPPSNMHFSESIGKRGISIYVQKLSEALNSGAVVQIAHDDSYMRHQLKAAAKKIGVKLVYALADGFLYVKPIALEGDRKRLLLLLREPRTKNELMAQKLELHLENTLAEFAKAGMAHAMNKAGTERWVLTEKGMDNLQ